MQLSNRFTEALGLACRLHAMQQRKGTEIPYVGHLLAVTAIVLQHAGTEDEAIAAMLHDAVEDQGGAQVLHEIRERFGSSVAEIVEGCSDADQTPKPPWQQRKQAYLAHLRVATASMRLVSAADKLDNARALLTDYRACGDLLWTRFNAGREDILWYYESLVAIFRETSPSPLVEELERVVMELTTTVRRSER